MKISNDLLFVFLMAAVVYRILMLDADVFLEGLAGMVIPFALLWIFFRFRKIGAGDIKLFCVLGAFMGPAAVLCCMLCSFTAGGGVALMDLFVYEKRPAAEKEAEGRFSRLNVAVLTVPAVLMWFGGLYG